MQENIVKHKWLQTILFVETKFARVEAFITAVMFFGMMTLIFIQVACRYIFFIPMPWSEELVRYLFIVVSFIGAGVASFDNTHIEINLLTSLLNKIKDEGKKKNITRYFNIFKYILIVGVSFWMAKLCYDFTVKINNMGQLTPAMRIPMWYVDAFICLGLAMVLVHSLVKLVTEVAGYSTNCGGDAE
ncbi:MAG TPA: TRAP transporter small permease [Smithellaceae bacterium]|nr:TRAP transporter small permease [Smithellaceae bacterium]